MSMLRDLLDSQDATSSINIPSGITDNVGQLNTAMRAQSDLMAEAVTTAGTVAPQRMSRIGLSSFVGAGDTAKYLRRGMVAIAAFAGVGIVHRLVTGDRSVDEANPYPLIPKGSNYESIANRLDFQQAPVVESGSMSYKIRAHGVTDVSQLSQSIQGVLPQGNTTIYQSRAPGLSNTGSSSRSILNERLG